MFAFDLLGISFAHFMGMLWQVTRISAPVIGVELLDTERHQVFFQRD